MAEEQLEQIEEEQIDESQVEDKQGEQKEETPEQKKEGLLTRIKNIVKGDKETEGRTIPGDFVAAANEIGWPDDEIQEFAAEYTDEQLIEMIPYLSNEEQEDEVKDDSEAEPEKKDEKEEEKTQDDSQIKELLEKVNKLEEKLGEVDKEKEEQNTIDLANRANQIFDEAGKEFEIFGQTKDLPRFPDGRLIPNSPQFKARSEVWEDAKIFMSAGRNPQEAMEKALAVYKGVHLTKDVKRNVIKDLKRSEKSLSAKRANNETIPKNLSGPETIEAVLQKQGRT